ncbi:MAG TPA: tetratricopeptide repeat protein [Acetobacteraceae bacterium]|nr:tetratricopeptide repeat protein [Acetobacteraceae bacterium]
MQHVQSARRAFLLAISLLSACGAADISPSKGASHGAIGAPSGVFGDYLVGRFAMSQADPQTAATQFLRGLAVRPGDADLVQSAFIACLVSGRTEAVQLARELPDSQAAQLLLGEVAARAGHWQAAEQQFRTLPHQGLTQFLQPMLVAWAQQGDGRTDAALATLRPYLDGQRFRGVYALHAALIADQAGRTAEAAKLYHTAQVEFGGTNLRLAQMLASWEMRHGHPAEAQHVLASMATSDTPQMAIALPALLAATKTPPVRNATDGIAEAYLALAATLRQQDAGNFAMVLLRLAMDLRPDLTAARILAADILQDDQHYDSALQMLAPVGADDPLSPVIRLQRAAIAEQLGHTDEAMQELQRIAHDYPDSPLPMVRQGDLLRTKQRFTDAIAAYDRAVALIKTPTESDWLLFYDRGTSYDRAHQWDKAQADFQHALKLSPEQPYVLNYFGYTWADKSEHLPQARDMVEKALQHRPNDGAIVDSLGWVMFRQGQITDAVKTLERAVELQPEDAEINGHLGDAYWAAGRKLEAAYQWRRALTFNPEPDDAAKLEAKLQNGGQATLVSGQ